jgi:hypothetical protein
MTVARTEADPHPTAATPGARSGAREDPAAIDSDAERLTSVPRSLAAAASPAIAGALFAASFQALPLLICGTLKIVYDLLLLAQFRRVKPPEEQ